MDSSKDNILKTYIPELQNINYILYKELILSPLIIITYSLEYGKLFTYISVVIKNNVPHGKISFNKEGMIWEPQQKN